MRFSQAHAIFHDKPIDWGYVVYMCTIGAGLGGIVLLTYFSK